MKRNRFIFAITVLVLAIAIWAYQHLTDQGPGQIYRAETGLFKQALLIDAPDSSDVTFVLIFPFGETANPYSEGLAHYVEHLAWLSAFENNGAHSNAWTDQLSTGYWQSSETKDAEETLQHLIKVADPFALDNDFALQERDIVLREYDLRVREWPLYPILREVEKTLYGSGALARSVIGEPDQIVTYDPAQAAALHQQSHDLTQATLLVHGPMTKWTFERILRSLPAPSQATPAPMPAALVAPEPMQSRATVTHPGLGDDTYIYRKIVPVPPCGTAADCGVAVELAQSALASTLPGGVGGPLRFDHFIARSFDLDLLIISDTHLELRFTANPDQGVTLAALEEAFQSALQATLQQGLPAATFARMKDRITDDLASVLDRDIAVYNRDLALGLIATGKPVYTLRDERAAIARLQPATVDALLRSLHAEGRDVSRLISTER